MDNIFPVKGKEICEALFLMQLLGDLLEMKKEGKADYKSNKFYFLMQKSG